jgi:hypothetical protein
MRLKTISATSLKMFELCGLQWRYKYKDDLLQLPNPAFIIGTAFHKGAELFHKGVPAEAIIERLKTDLLSEKSTPQDLDNFAMVRNMVERYIANPIDTPTIETEYKFSIPIFSITAPLFGYIDRIVEGGIVEYKTSANDYTIDDLDNVQTDIYSYAYHHRFRQMPLVTYCVLNKTKSKRSDYRPQVLTITRPESALIDLTHRLQKFEQDVASEHFYANPGTHCRWCPFSSSCPYSYAS